MADVTQKELYEIIQTPAGAMPGGDFISQLNKLAGEANKFIDGLKMLSEKSGLPLIGQDGAISKFAGVPTKPPPPPPPAPIQARTTPPPAAAPAPAAPAFDWPAILDKIDAEIKKRGLGGITIGMIYEVYKDKSLSDLLKEVKGNGTGTPQKDGR